MARLGLLGRIMLILMAALVVVVVAALALGHFERAERLRSALSPYPRVEQAAGVIDLLRKADPALRPEILRALNGARLTVAIRDEAPPETDALRRAPRLEAMLRAYADGNERDLRAYTSAAMPERDPAEAEIEGRLQRAVWQMPDGKYLVIGEIGMPRRLLLRLLGFAPGLWIGLLGIGVAGLALYGAQREMRPLRRLTRMAATFDGAAPSIPSDAAELRSGAPDIRRLVQAVHAMQGRVATLLQERSFLIGAISHDLKTYLTRLRLRAENLPDEDKRASLVGDLDAMTDLIDTSLAFARGTTVSQQRGRVDLADLLAVEAAERMALGQPVALMREDAPDMNDAVVAGDPVALRRVLANLVDNAVKFGRDRVEIAVETTPDACRIVVDDDGAGVDEAERSAIFSPFYRIETSRSRRTGGSGLGLAIARQIVEAHGGTIEVSRAALGGARFSVSLPRAVPG